MAKNDGAEAIMSLAEMKPILNLSKRQPVGCALALTKDKQGIIQRWSPFFGQVVKLGSPDEKDGPDDGQAEAVWC